MNKHYTFKEKNTFPLIALALFCLALFSSCFKAKPFNPTDVPQWEKVSQLRTNDPIQNLIGTPTEVYVITESEFARIKSTDTLIEKRLLSTFDGVVARPVLDDNFFVRYTVQEGKDVIEFHNTGNHSQVIRIVADDLKNPEDDEVKIDREARLNGAFNDTETQFVLLTIVNFRYTAFYFDIEPSMNYEEILSLTPTHRIDLEDIEEGEDQLQVVRFVNGNYYVGTKNGAYRLTPDGNAERPDQIGDFGRWIIDFFEKDNRIIATGFNSFDQHTSLDNGLTWLRSGEESELKEVEVVGDTIFSHQSLGFPWEISLDAAALKTQEIFYSEEIEIDAGSNNSFYGIGYSKGKFYIGYEKDIFFIDEVTVVEE